MTEPTKAFFLSDPNWGDPVLDLRTAHETAYGARCAAVLSLEHGLYSGAHFANGAIQPGDWERMQIHGFRIVEVSISYVGEFTP